MPRSKLLAWLLILATWVATPFINDRIPHIALWGYWVLAAVAVIYGLWTAIKAKAWVLMTASVLTVVAWPLMLFLVLRFFGFN